MIHPEEPIKEYVKNEITQISRAVSDFITERFGKEMMGFVILLFDFHSEGFMSYSSNADRNDMIKALEELLENLKAEARVN